MNHDRDIVSHEVLGCEPTARWMVSNSHKAVDNLISTFGDARRERRRSLCGIKVGGDAGGPLFMAVPALHNVKDTCDAREAYSKGVIGHTSWLFTRPEWEGALDYLFIDEAG